MLETQEGEYYLFKNDILAGMCTYSSDKNLAANLETISAARAREVIAMNRRGEKPLSLHPDGTVREEKKPVDLLADTDVSRFDKARKKKKSPRRGRHQDDGQRGERRYDTAQSSKPADGLPVAEGEQGANQQRREERQGQGYRRNGGQNRYRSNRPYRSEHQDKSAMQGNLASQPHEHTASAPRDDAGQKS